MPSSAQQQRSLLQLAKSASAFADPLSTGLMPPARVSPRLSPHPAPGTEAPAMPLATQLPHGRLVELAGERAGCQMTQAVACLRQAQHRGETSAWVQLEGGSLFPPDLADSGIDLRALVVVHVPRSTRHLGLAKAAELLLRSGGFGMVVVDLWGSPADPQTAHVAWQGRLLGMAREHHSWVILLSPPQRAARARPPRRGAPSWAATVAGDAGGGHESGGAASTSLGPLIGLRLSTHRQRVDVGRFALTTRVLKDKSGSLGALAEEHRRGPWGYR